MQSVTEFRYLGRILTNTDDDWPAVARNLQKARVIWGRLARILGREGADLKVSRNFYIAVTQQVLLFGAERWVLTKNMEAALDAFQGRVARRLTRRMPRRGRDGKWLYLPLAGATKDAGIVRARTSVLRRQNTVVQFVATRPILVLCEGTERRGGTWVPQIWWEQPRINWRLDRDQNERAETAGETYTKATAGTTTATTETETSGPEKGTGEEASLGASGSSGAEWSGAED